LTSLCLSQIPELSIETIHWPAAVQCQAILFPSKFRELHAKHLSRGSKSLVPLSTKQVFLF